MDKSALSKFETDIYATYADYFKEKYECTIYNPTFPLILVKRISEKLRYINKIDKETKNKKNESYENFEEHLIPELCVKQEFPSSLWIQAKLIPSILYRIEQLLRAEELLKTITLDMNLEYVGSKNWKPLCVDNRIKSKLEQKKIKHVTYNEDSAPVTELKMSDLNANLKDFKKVFDDKLLEEQYPWKDSEEPLDIDRVLHLTPIEIYYYDNFIKKRVESNEVISKNVEKKWNNLALTYHQGYTYKHINLLKKKTSIQSPELSQIYRALTAIHCREIVNFERLETLGDSFLKYITSVYIILTFPKFDEGKASALKSKLVSNRNLFYLGIKKKIPNILQFNEFEPKSEWCPPGFCVPKVFKDFIKSNKISETNLCKFYIPQEEQMSGVLSEDTVKINIYNGFLEDAEKEGITGMCHFMGYHYVPDKIIADVMEALLGVYFKACGVLGMCLIKIYIFSFVSNSLI